MRLNLICYFIILINTFYIFLFKGINLYLCVGLDLLRVYFQVNDALSRSLLNLFSIRIIIVILVTTMIIVKVRFHFQKVRHSIHNSQNGSVVFDNF